MRSTVFHATSIPSADGFQGHWMVSSVSLSFCAPVYHVLLARRLRGERKTSTPSAKDCKCDDISIENMMRDGTFLAARATRLIYKRTLTFATPRQRYSLSNPSKPSPSDVRGTVSRQNHEILRVDNLIRILVKRACQCVSMACQWVTGGVTLGHPLTLFVDT